MLYSFLQTHIDQIGQFVLGAGIVIMGLLQKKYFKHQVEKAQEIHILVNSQKEELEKRVVELEAQLEEVRGALHTALQSTKTVGE